MSLLLIDNIIDDLKSVNKSISLGNILEYISSNTEIQFYKEMIPKKLILNNSYEKLINDFLFENANGNEIEFIEYFKNKETDFSLYLKDITSFEHIDEDIDQKKIKVFLGRKQEIKLLDIFLNRDIKRNVLVVGNPGTGKTTLIKYYSQLSQKKIREVHFSSILANTKYRGEFENKLTNEIDNAIGKREILFIDEAHTLISGGESEGGISAANILKPYLTDEGFTMIGATSIDEYEVFLKDKAFERRFNFLFLNEISQEDLYILFEKMIEQKSLRNKNTFYKIISILNEYLPNRYYPDKLIDFVDFFNSAHRIYEKIDFEDIVFLFELAIPKGKELIK